MRLKITNTLGSISVSLINNLHEACRKLHEILQPKISNRTKLSFFTACVEKIVTYGSKTCTLKCKVEKCLDAIYAHLLMQTWRLCWKKQPALAEICFDVVTISETIKKRRMRFAAHCLIATDHLIADCIL